MTIVQFINKVMIHDPRATVPVVDLLGAYRAAADKRAATRHELLAELRQAGYLIGVGHDRRTRVAGIEFPRQGPPAWRLDGSRLIRA